MSQAELALARIVGIIVVVVSAIGIMQTVRWMATILIHGVPAVAIFILLAAIDRGELDTWSSVLFTAAVLGVCAGAIVTPLIPYSKIDYLYKSSTRSSDAQSE